MRNTQRPVSQAKPPAPSWLSSSHRIRGLSALLAAIMVIGLPLYSARAANGDLDPTFGTGGKVTTDFSTPAQHSSTVSALVIQPDGHLIAVGSGKFGTAGQDLLLVRYNPDGTLDNSYGTAGKVVSSIGAVDVVADCVLQPDGKLVVVGFTSGSQIQVRRFNRDGTPDTSFGFNGHVETTFKAFNFAHSVMLQSDGKIVVVGEVANNIDAAHGDGDFAVVRYTANGNLDGTFGVGGLATTDFAGGRDNINRVALQSDGKIVVVGYASSSDNSKFTFALARYTSTGSLDPTFGAGGKLTTSFSTNDTALFVVIQPDGKIIATGFDDNFSTVLARYDSGGNLDAVFGAGGKVSVPKFDPAIALRLDGKIVLAGDTPVNPTTGQDFSLVLLNPTGSLDTTFGTNGEVTTDFANRNDHINAVLLQPDGKIVAAGDSGANFDNVFALARYVSDSAGPSRVDTPTGSNVTVTTANAAVSFSNVSQAGTTTFTPISPNSAGAPPSGYTITTNGPAYDITTTATYTPPIDVCFTVTSINDATAFSKLRLLHGENGVLVDRTFRQDFGARQICARVSSLSPFVLAMTDTPFANPTSQLLNISTRMRVLTDDKVLIGGFIITGTDPKRVIIRGIGPSLNGVGVTLSDPTLELHQPDGTVITNDNWKINAQTGQSQEADIRATTIPPGNDLEAALVATLSPGNYSVVLGGKNRGTGVGLVEVYDLAQAANSKLANISSRGFVDINDNVMIGGFIVGGTGGGSAKVIVRAIGPSLSVNGAAVPGRLADPTLELHNASGTMIVTNDNWKISDQTGQSQKLTSAPRQFHLRTIWNRPSWPRSRPIITPPLCGGRPTRQVLAW